MTPAARPRDQPTQAEVKALRSNPLHRDIPIIMVTTEAAKKEILEAIKSGVTDYIVKPFTPETLKEKIQKVLGG